MNAQQKIKTTGAFVSGFGKYHTTGQDRPLTYSSLDLIREAVDNPPSVPKDQAQWIIPSSLQSRSKSEQLEQGRYQL